MEVREEKFKPANPNLKQGCTN